MGLNALLAWLAWVFKLMQAIFPFTSELRLFRTIDR